ncbi:protein SCO1 homolog, mitochondrial-like [Branchiostoma lanceolatum]|uniref:protein SCO1 homolog, mitochondrial-like n=1 Tax=Branchiostoma lanceolatum TaxID=7740 RepID=UPI003451B74E
MLGHSGSHPTWLRPLCNSARRFSYIFGPNYSLRRKMLFRSVGRCLLSDTRLLWSRNDVFPTLHRAATRAQTQVSSCSLCTCPVGRRPLALLSSRPAQQLRRMTSDPVPPSRPKPERTASVWKALVGAGGLGAALLLYFNYLKREKELALEKERSKSLGKALIGGPISMVDHHGNPKTEKDYEGQWCLLYFGFTHCPDICPDELDKMAQVVTDMANIKTLPNITPIFISIDPERDDVKSIAEYVKEFHPDLVGLTGSLEQVKQVSKNFRVYYSQGPIDDDGDYIVDHTIIMYLMNPDWQFLDYYGKDKNSDQIVASIAGHMRKYRS